MELVYVWIKNYKNIEKQGFNFSPRFHCDYNENTNELIIDENDGYISNFFGKNINVTAIVGKNGSGKSSVLNFIREIIFPGISRDLLNYTGLMIFYNHEDSFYYELRDNVLELKIKKNSRTLQVKKIDLQNSKIAFPLFTHDKHIFSFEDDISLFPHFITTVDNNVISKLMIRNHDKLAKYNLIKRFNKFYNPKKVKIYINFDEFLLEGLNEISNNNVKELIEKSKQFFQKNNFKEGIESIREIILIVKDYDKKDWISNINIDSWLKLEESLYTKNRYKDFKDASFSPNIFYSQLFEWDLSEVKELKNFIDDFDIPCFLIELIDEQGITFHSLSYGEKSFLQLINFILNLVFKEYIQIFNFDDNYQKHNYQVKNFFILFDEIELGMHPVWQKNIFNNILEFCNILDSKIFHLILTSHSPFLLSDIPKQNIIFLDKEENRNCKVLNHDEVLAKKQTFGANIHTLLSDSFFMEDGLMGEFAKSKINEIIDFHKTVQKKRHTNCLKKIYLAKRKDRFWQTQSIIGEEYLKQVVKNHLVEIEKILLGKDGAKKEEIIRVEAYLESLKK